MLDLDCDKKRPGLFAAAVVSHHGEDVTMRNAVVQWTSVSYHTCKTKQQYQMQNSFLVFTKVVLTLERKRESLGTPVVNIKVLRPGPFDIEESSHLHFDKPQCGQKSNMYHRTSEYSILAYFAFN